MPLRPQFFCGFDDTRLSQLQMAPHSLGGSAWEGDEDTWGLGRAERRESVRDLTIGPLSGVDVPSQCPVTPSCPPQGRPQCPLY